MSIVIAVWPNNTISVLRMRAGFTAIDLFNELDAEGSPLDARCYLVSQDDDGMQITFNWRCKPDGRADNRRLRIGKLAGRIKRLRWPDGIEIQWLKSL